MPTAVLGADVADIVYFSSVSGNTARFVEKLGRPASRIPLYDSEPALEQREPYVLIVPTYGSGNGKGAVPKQVIKFLNDEQNRKHLRGVIAAGNTNFGAGYGLAGDIIARKCGVPHLYRFDLFGTADDVRVVQEGLDALWQR